MFAIFPNHGHAILKLLNNSSQEQEWTLTVNVMGRRKNFGVTELPVWQCKIDHPSQSSPKEIKVPEDLLTRVKNTYEKAKLDANLSHIRLEAYIEVINRETSSKKCVGSVCTTDVNEIMELFDAMYQIF